MVTPAAPVQPPPPPPPGRVLVCGVNWLGDAIISMPAIQAYRWENPEADITLLVRPSLLPLWNMHAAPNRVIALPAQTSGLRPLAQTLRELSLDTAFILPHSFRSALPAWLAGIPRRVGTPGHFPRDWMLTEVHPPAVGPGREHQVYEYLDLFFPGALRRTYPRPSLTVPPPVVEQIHRKLGNLPTPWIALIPGAARGPAKQWPSEHYALAAAKLMAATGGSIITLGTAAEYDACQQVAAAAAPNGMNLAGQTTLAELAGVLALSAGVLCNDSGGMHLAAALGTPLVAIYGITNPGQTGPLGRTQRILQRSEHRSRDIPRRSPKAQKALAAILPEEAVQALLPLL